MFLPVLTGDGFVVIQFLRLLSQTYQGLLPLDPSPSYSSHYSPLHATSTYPQESLMTPHLESPFPMGGKPPFMGRHKGEISRVDIHFRVETIEQIHKAVTLLANENTDEGSRSVAFSKQDTLIALLARASTKSDPRNAIQHIINFFMVCLSLLPTMIFVVSLSLPRSQTLLTAVSWNRFNKSDCGR